MQGKLDEVDVVKAWGVVFGVFVEKQPVPAVAGGW